MLINLILLQRKEPGHDVGHGPVSTDSYFHIIRWGLLTSVKIKSLAAGEHGHWLDSWIVLFTKAELNKQNRQCVSGHVEGSMGPDKKDKTGALQSQKGPNKQQHEAMSCHKKAISGLCNVLHLSGCTSLNGKWFWTCVTSQLLQTRATGFSCSFDFPLRPFKWTKQLLIGSTNQIFFFARNNSISSPLKAAASVCKVCQGDTAEWVIHQDFTAMETSSLLQELKALVERSEILLL